MARKEKGRGIRCGGVPLQGPGFAPRGAPRGRAEGDPRCSPRLQQKGDLAGPGRRVGICECGPVALYYVLSCL